MMDNKKLEEAKDSIFNKHFLKNNEGMICIDHISEPVYLDYQIKEAIGLGAKWAINELIKNLWHPANEIPKEFNHYGFAALYILQYNHQIRMVLYDKDNMSWKNVISINEYWLYVDDLLPKEGGEQ